jgi:hypothetical protein
LGRGCQKTEDGVTRKEGEREREMYGFYSGCCLIPGVVLVNVLLSIYILSNILVFGRLIFSVLRIYM